MHKSLKNARLVLNSAAFFPATTTFSTTSPGTLDTRIGTADNIRSNCTWTNLDWRVILGDMYEQYTTFSLCLESINFLGTGNTFGTGYAIQANARGLPWLNQCYDVISKGSSDTCQFYSGPLNTSSVTLQSEGCIFTRPNRFTDFNITFTGNSGGYSVASCTNFVFRIYGIDKK